MKSFKEHLSEGEIVQFKRPTGEFDSWYNKHVYKTDIMKGRYAATHRGEAYDHYSLHASKAGKKPLSHEEFENRMKEKGHEFGKRATHSWANTGLK